MNPMSQEDLLALLQKAKTGDAGAFATVYEELYTPVFRYIYLRTRHRETTKDLVQEVFLKLYRSLNQFEIRDIHPLRFLFTVARNVIIDHGRKKREEIVDNETFLAVPDQGITGADHFDQAIAQNDVLTALKHLSEEQQMAIELRYFQEVSYEIIARELGKTEVATRKLVSRALKVLKQHFSYNE